MNYDSWINEKKIDLKLAFFTTDPNHQNIKSQIEKELKELIESQFPKDQTYNIILIERKGLFLFHSLLKELDHNGISSIKLFKMKKHANINSSYKYRKHVNFVQTKVIIPEKKKKSKIILTDAIGSGDELDDMLVLFSKGQITKVIGYLANKSTLNRLKEKYPEIQFIFPKQVDNSEYLLENRNLQTVYQSRLERMDEEHPLQKIKIEPPIDINLLTELIKSAIFPFYHGINNLKSDDLAINLLNGYSYNFWQPNELFNDDFKIDSNYFFFDRVQLRFRYSKISSCLSVMALALPNSNTSGIKYNMSRVLFGKCHLKLPYKLCSDLKSPYSRISIMYLLSFIEKRKREPFCDIYCPTCIGLNVSKYILNNFLQNFHRELKEHNFNCSPRDLLDNCED